MQTISPHEEPFEGKTSTELAAGCFAIGTILFLLYLILLDNSSLILVAFLFIVLATPLNIIMLYHLLYHFCKLPDQRKYIGIKIVILLCNIPIAFLYYNILINFKLL
ncbi:hypothetical protein [Flavobacterium adhaerens]|uniref:hypothetical protein n=1 Tax=Flavobacterium adhaerens TaxID=3149043 RepID=UPI0032B4D14B